MVVDFRMLYWFMVGIFWLTLLVSAIYLILHLTYFGISESQDVILCFFLHITISIVGHLELSQRHQDA